MPNFRSLQQKGLWLSNEKDKDEKNEESGLVNKQSPHTYVDNEVELKMDRWAKPSLCHSSNYVSSFTNSSYIQIIWLSSC